MDDDFRIFLVLRFEVGNGDYPAQRDLLEKSTWLTVDAFRAAGLYAAVSSFPRWSNVEDMGDYGKIHPVFPVNGTDCFCVQLQPSPLRESFIDSNALTQARPECRKTVAEHGEILTKMYGQYGLFTDIRWSVCLEDFRNSGFTKCMEKVIGIPAFNSGIVVLSTGGMPSLFGKRDFNTDLFSFWLNLVSPQPREVAFLF